jgi:hypothetical protein
MGIASSKDEAGKAILGSLPPGFLDAKGRALRDELDACLGASMWAFSLAGVALALPLCVRYRTERPLMAAAVTCPVLDMMYGTVRCDAEKDAFVAHYRDLQASYDVRVARGEAGAAGGGARQRWRPDAAPSADKPV